MSGKDLWSNSFQQTRYQLIRLFVGIAMVTMLYNFYDLPGHWGRRICVILMTPSIYSKRYPPRPVRVPVAKNTKIYYAEKK